MATQLPQKFELARNQEAAAMNKYNRFYDNHLYVEATRGTSNRYANDLINEALAICGSPYYKMSNRRWAHEALEFLKKFS